MLREAQTSRENTVAPMKSTRQHQINLSQLTEEESASLPILWVPSLEQIAALSAKELEAHELEFILCHIGLFGETQIKRLSFVFADGQVSPPFGTYSQEPDRPLCVKFDHHIGKVVFCTFSACL